jgi:hypothetical protein
MLMIMPFFVVVLRPESMQVMYDTHIILSSMNQHTDESEAQHITTWSC